jgi:hypothetical protein
MHRHTIAGLTLLALLALAGCGSAYLAPVTWMKPDGTPQQAQRDLWECKVQASQVAPMEYNTYREIMEPNARQVAVLQHECMTAKGWTAQRTASTH